MLYAANLLDKAEPVETKPTKSRKKVPKTALPSPITDVSSPSSPVPPAPKKRVKRKAESVASSEESVDPVPVEKVDSRKRKRDETKAALEEEKKVLQERVAEAERKQKEEAELKLQKAEARKQKRQQAQELKALEKSLNEAYASEFAKLKTDREEPPAWFKKYVGSVKKEENALGEKKPGKVVNEEIVQVAEKTWNDGVTRDRVKQEVDNHMNRMYSQIFGNRRKA